jgi:hypothetical protein
MCPETSEASANAGPGVLLGGEHRPNSPSAPETQQLGAAQPSEFDVQAQVLGAQLGLTGPTAKLILFHHRGMRE